MLSVELTFILDLWIWNNRINSYNFNVQFDDVKCIEAWCVEMEIYLVKKMNKYGFLGNCSLIKIIIVIKSTCQIFSNAFNGSEKHTFSIEGE